MNKIFNGDCLEIMKTFADGSIDMVFCDLPYGTTRNPWDTIIPLDELWQEYKIIGFPRTIVLIGGRAASLQHLHGTRWQNGDVDAMLVVPQDTNTLALNGALAYGVNPLAFTVKRVAIIAGLESAPRQVSI